VAKVWRFVKNAKVEILTQTSKKGTCKTKLLWENVNAVETLLQQFGKTK
jgi:hypothetical protein